jgi:hypothetical protein
MRINIEKGILSLVCSSKMRHLKSKTNPKGGNVVRTRKNCTLKMMTNFGVYSVYMG